MASFHPMFLHSDDRKMDKHSQNLKYLSDNLDIF